VTEKQVPALCSYLSSYVGSFPEVEEVTDVRGAVMNGVFTYTATAIVSGEEVKISF